MNPTADLEAIRLALFTGQKSAAKAAAQEAFLRLVKRVTDIDFLDAWATANDQQHALRGGLPDEEQRYTVVLGYSDDHFFEGDTITAARAAAVEAIKTGGVS